MNSWCGVALWGLITPQPNTMSIVGVRGLPERVIESLGVMGMGAGGGRKFFRKQPLASPGEGGEGPGFMEKSQIW